VEMGVSVREEETHERTLQSIAVKDTLIMQQWVHHWHTKYTLKSVLKTDSVVTIEAPKVAGWDMEIVPKPQHGTLNELRWQVTVPANQTVPFKVTRGQIVSEYVELISADAMQLAHLLEHANVMAPDLQAALREIIALYEQIAKVRESMTILGKERERRRKEQDDARENMKVMGSTPEEAELRAKMVAKIASTHDRLEAITQEFREKYVEIEGIEARIKTLIETLTGQPAKETPNENYSY
jgi:hypothetical protein